jgi:transcriptional regulator with XRE-family HTH domain
MGKYSDFSRERFALMLTHYRTQQGLNQQELAKLVGRSAPTISVYESAERDPSCATYTDLANALNIDPIQFFINDNALALLQSNDIMFSEDDVVSGSRMQLIAEISVKLRSLSDNELLALNIVIDSMTGHNKQLIKTEKK